MYPGAAPNGFAVNKVSFTIRASSMVVIVGENGSGKSSLVKLLTQLFCPTSGQILIDDIDATAYHVDDLYAATALLTQDHTVFPLTVAENIGIGDVGAIGDMVKIKEAARLGGASDFIQSMARGYEQTLTPVHTWGPTRFPLPEGELKKFADEVERRKDISGKPFQLTHHQSVG